jgi:AcrR family transcriptional regulator
MPVSTASNRRAARERILDAASDLFYREGFRAAGIDTIVARAGVAKMTLYHHFPSKDELVVAFLRRRDERWRCWFGAAVERRAATPRERLLAAFDALEEWFASPDFRGCAFINAAAEFPDPEHPARQAVLEHKQQVRAYLHQLSIETGLSDADALAQQLLILMEGAIVTAVIEGGAAAAQGARRAAAVLLSVARRSDAGGVQAEQDWGGSLALPREPA